MMNLPSDGRAGRTGLEFRAGIGVLALTWALLLSPQWANADADNQAQVASDAAVNFNSAAFGANVAQATLSPDGTRVAYQKKTPQGWRIFIGNTDGSNCKPLTSGPGDDVEASWRPDGALLAFSSSRSGHWNIYLVHSDGTSLRSLTHGTTDSRSPQWSPLPFDLPYDKDPLYHLQTDLPRSDVPPTDLKMLRMLATGSSEWQTYEDRFQTYKAARYYKLLFVQGAGDHRRIVTIREDGRQEMLLDTGISGAQTNPCWDRTASRFAFVVRLGDTSAIYSADYPVTHDLNEGEGKLRFGIDRHDLRVSLHRLAVVNGAAELSWTPNGEYVAVASGNSMRLLPKTGRSLQPINLPIRNVVAPFGFGWLPDARTALITVIGNGGSHFETVACQAPLLDVVNVGDFDDLKPVDRVYLNKNAFVATGEPQLQMFDVYEETDYQNLPIFVTTDSLLHLNHLVFDYLLRGVESDHLTPDLITLVTHYLISSLEQAKSSDDQNVVDAASANAAFFAVAARLAMGDVHTGENASEPVDPDDPLAADREALRHRQDAKDRVRLQRWTAELKQTLATLPPQVMDLADQEIALISAHGGEAISPVFGGEAPNINSDGEVENDELDYSDFIPRGHYTQSEVLRRYFLMSHWLSAGSFRRTTNLTQRALLIVCATDPETLALWQKIETTIHQFAGPADDQDIDAYMPIAKDVYGGAPTAASIFDASKSEEFLDRVASLPSPRIDPAAGPSFRFMPAPATPDAEIMQGLVYNGSSPGVGTKDRPRYFALGLDVMSVLGSDRAHTLLQTTEFQGGFFDFDLMETQYANYDQQYQSLLKQFASRTEADWSGSLYDRTLYALLPLLAPPADAAPTSNLFTQNEAWTDKSLNTALGAWAELKHDVMPKQPVSTEAGGEGGISEAVVAVQPVGFVEPAPEVYRRLGLLVAAEHKTLADEGYLDASVAERLDTLADLLTMIQYLSTKQSSGANLSPREVEQLRFYGGYQEHLALVTAEGGEQGSTEGNDMAIIADVSSAFSIKLNKLLALEEGVGRALPIYVAVPFNGHRELTCGAVFTQYEFTHPAEDRLTDAKWRALLNANSVPDMPKWTKSFVSRVENTEP